MPLNELARQTARDTKPLYSSPMIIVSESFPSDQIVCATSFGDMSSFRESRLVAYFSALAMYGASEASPE